jgi:hypothetical protein
VLFSGAPGAFATGGSLTAGTQYHLFFSADTPSESWSFSLALVPEPGTFGLVALGIAALTGMSRRMR